MKTSITSILAATVIFVGSENTRADIKTPNNVSSSDEIVGCSDRVANVALSVANLLTLIVEKTTNSKLEEFSVYIKGGKAVYVGKTRTGEPIQGLILQTALPSKMNTLEEGVIMKSDPENPETTVQLECIVEVTRI